ncbi:hypothetical protein BDF22DRAFT_323424 [Syncephalis plumigaleata]|nr:hypothetical protein BDF22DRAFT_323424 [Syncephalis plumigaleata]
MSTTTTTTEISSNSNSSCRLLDCLNSLPFHDQCVFRSLLGHIELVRLSACCHSLKSNIRNDRALWQELYHRDFLSGAYYAKEMEFVLWCIRTDVNNPCTSDKRADLLENVDWYNTYRRRVSTENNWRYGRCNTTYIDMQFDKDEIDNCIEAGHNNSAIILLTRLNGTSRSCRYHALEYLPHSNLRASNNTVYNSTFSTSPNVLSLGSGNAALHKYVLGDHYIAVSPYASESNTDINVKILSHKHGGIFTTFDVPARYKVKAVEAKWVLLVHDSHELFNGWQIFNVMVFDIDNSIMCPGIIDDMWNAIRFYKTTNDTAIVYTARLLRYKRIEWALYQFSSNNPAVQLRSGWFQLPKEITGVPIFLAHNSYDLHIIIELCSNYYHHPYIIHSVASGGQSHLPRNCYTITDQYIPIPLLRAGCRYSMYDSKPTKVWADISYDDDQVIQIPGTSSIKHIIGDLYVFIVSERNCRGRRLLVDTNTKEIIRKLEAPTKIWKLSHYAMVGMLYSPCDSHVEIIQEYGEL